MLAEVSTKDISAAVEPQNFEESKNVAQQGGNVAIKALESKTGTKVVSTLHSKEVVAPLPLDSAKNMLVDFQSFSVQCCIFFVAHVAGCYCLCKLISFLFLVRLMRALSTGFSLDMLCILAYVII